MKKILNSIFFQNFHRAINNALATMSGLVWKIQISFETDFFNIKSSFNLALLFLSGLLLLGFFPPWYIRLVFLIGLSIIFYLSKIYQRYIHRYFGLALKWSLGPFAGTTCYRPSFKATFVVGANNFLKAVFNHIFSYFYTFIVIFILLSTNYIITSFMSYILIVGGLIFFKAPFYLPLVSLWIVAANFIFYFFDKTYSGFINNLKKHNPELENYMKILLTKLNILTVRHWIIRGFSSPNFLDVDYNLNFENSFQDTINYLYPPFFIKNLYKERLSYFYIEGGLKHQQKYCNEAFYIPLKLKEKWFLFTHIYPWEYFF